MVVEEAAPVETVAEQVFVHLIEEFLRRTATESTSIPKPKQEPVRVDQGNARAPYTYFLILDALQPDVPPLDYARLFGYLGETRTATEIYQDHYAVAAEEQKGADSRGGEGLSERVIEREMLRDRRTVAGLGFLDYGDPSTREKYELRRKLMHKDTIELRQALAAF